MNIDRFANVLGEEYNLFSKAVLHHDEFQDKVAEEIKKYVSTLKNKDKIIVVEGGCGTGITTERILKVDERIEVIGVDNEEKTIKQAKVILNDFGERVVFKKDDLLNALKLMTDDSADVFTSVWVIHNLDPEYRTKLFPEIARILKPGGLFVSGDKYAHNDPATHKEGLENQIKSFDVFEDIDRSDLKKEWTEHYIVDEKIKITENEQINILEDLGFSNCTVQYRKGMEAVIIGVR